MPHSRRTRDFDFPIVGPCAGEGDPCGRGARAADVPRRHPGRDRPAIRSCARDAGHGVETSASRMKF